MDSTKILIIQGDTYETLITFQNLPADDLIENVYFTCNRLDLKKECEGAPGNSKQWFLSLDTSELASGCYNYDLTVKFRSDKVLTVIHNGDLKILSKENVI